MQCKKQKYFVLVPLFSQLCLCFHSCAMLLYDSYVRFRCCEFFLLLCIFLQLCNLQISSTLLHLFLLTDHSTPPKWVENQFQPAPYSLNLTALRPNTSSTLSSLHSP